MHRLAPRCGLAALSLLGLSAHGPLAQSGPGLPNLVYQPSEVFKIISTFGSGSHGHSVMHDGYLAVLQTGYGVLFYDFSNPYSPTLVRTVSGMTDLVEGHTVAQTTAWGGQHMVMMRGPGGLGGTGFAIWDFTDLANPRREVSYNLPNVPGGYASGTFWLFAQPPYLYCPVGSLGLYIVDISDPANPQVVTQVSKSQLGGFNTVLAFAVGNLLVLTNSDSGAGFAHLDISDPINPVLINSSPNTVIPYGAQVNGGDFIVPAVSGCASCGGGGNGAFHVYRITAAGFPLVNEHSLPSRGGSAVRQDQAVHIAASTHYVKLDVSDPLEGFVELGRVFNPTSGGDIDWVTPMGNLVTLGDDQNGATKVVPHQQLPDNTGPSVNMVNPSHNATNQALTSRVGLTFTDMVALESIDASTVTVRPIGGQPLAGMYTMQFGIVNFAPEQPLAPNTTYEVVVPAGGIRDWSGNAAPTTFVSRFSTGGQVNAVVPTVLPATPVEPGDVVNLDVAGVTGTGPFQFSWDFGDGTPPTPYSSSSQASHSYAEPGHYSVRVSVTNGSVIGADSYIQTVHAPLTAVAPTHAATIALDEGRDRVWCVNADNDTVTAINTLTLQKVFEVPVGDHPRTLAHAPDGTVWVVCEDDATVHVLDGATGASLAVIALPYASAPYGIAFRPDGAAAYVTLRAIGRLARLDPTTRTLRTTTHVGPEPKGLAIAADSERIFVSRFMSSPFGRPLPSAIRPAGGVVATSAGNVPVVEPQREPQSEPYGEIYEVAASTFTRVRTIPLAMDATPDTEASGRGLPNYLNTLTISPDGRRLLAPSKKDNIGRGLFRSGEPLDFDNTVRTIVSQVDLTTNREIEGARVDLNDRDLAFATVFSPLGDYAFHAVQGGNAIDVRDAYNDALVAVFDGTGKAPQGLAISTDGRTLYVHNFMSRTVAVLDVGGVTDSTTFALPLLASVSTVASEKLAPQVLLGKQIFYDGTDPRMNEDGYLSCATCHLDGGHDGQTWDFSDRGEGLRNTTSLLGKAGTGHGRVHWTANFDEIQDFENDMRNAFGGDGFLTALQFSGPAGPPLGAPKAGLSPELDALAAYVSTLDVFARSPHRNPDGTLTQAGVRGKAVFTQLGCAQCHSGGPFTDSPSGVLHDVGTIRAPSSGHASGGAMTGVDTPTLRGLWATAPYLHDGSARTLRDVLTTRNPQDQHGVTSGLSEQDLSDLVAYLQQIDGLEPAPQ